MRDKNINRGFTLVELTISLSIGAIIAVMLSIVLVNVNNIFNNNNYAMQKFNEFEDFKSQINEMCESYSSQGFELFLGETENSIIFKKGYDNILVEFESGKLKQNSSSVGYFKTINNCKFEIIANVVVVNVIFTNNSTLRFVI